MAFCHAKTHPSLWTLQRYYSSLLILLAGMAYSGQRKVHNLGHHIGMPYGHKSLGTSQPVSRSSPWVTPQYPCYIGTQPSHALLRPLS